MDEQTPGGALQNAATSEKGVQRLEQLAAGADQRAVDVVTQHTPGLAVAREGALGQEVGGGDRPGRGRPGRGGPEPGERGSRRLGRLVEGRHRRADHDRAVAEGGEQAFRRGEGIGGAAEDDHQPVAVHAAEDLHVDAASRPVDRVKDGGRLAAGGAADGDRDRRRVGPPEGGGAAGQYVGGVAAEQGVDKKSLQAGVPGAAGLDRKSTRLNSSHNA